MSYIPLLQDAGSLATVVIDSYHHETHEGSSFRYTDSVTLGAAGTQDYLITTPNTTKWSHFVYDVDGTAITTFTLYEAADRTGTTLQTTRNSNRNSASTAGMTIHKGTSGGTTDGVIISTYSSGTASGQSRQPSAIGFDRELILKQNTKYILRVTSGTAGNLCNVVMYWYEHTNAG